MWHITSAAVFTVDNTLQPVCVIYRRGGDQYEVCVEPGRELPASTLVPNENGMFNNFDDALAYAKGE